MRKINQFIICMIISIVFLMPTKVYPNDISWYNSAWCYRRSVTISDPGGQQLNGYQLKLTLDNSFDFAKVKTDGSDIRFTDSDGVTAIPFWIETWDPVNQNAILWVKIPIIPASGVIVYLYYGNSTANTVSDGNATFDFFDDFNSNLDSNKWNSSGAPPINNSILTINSGPNQYIQSKQTFQYKAYRCKAQFATYATCGNLGFKSSTIYVGFDDASYCCWSSGAVQSITANNLQWTWGYTGYEGTNWKTWEALWKPNEVKFYVDNQLRQVHSTNIPTIPLPFVVNSNSGSPVINVDWILVREYSDPEPVGSLGAEKLNVSLWNHRRPITITNPSGQSLTNYQIKLTLDNSFDFTKVKSDGSDIRFVDTDGETSISYWIETWSPETNTALIWIKVPLVPSAGTTIYLYYGNSGANIASSGDATFDFFDNFDKQDLPYDVYGNWKRVVVDNNLNGAHNINIDDVDLDGKPDLVVDACKANQVVWYKQPQDPINDTWTKYIIDNNLPNAHDVQVGDIDGDGLKDVVGLSLSENYNDYNQGNGSLVWYKRPNDPSGPWTKTVIASSGHTGLTGARSMVLGDIDGDGNLDIVVAVDAVTYQTTGRLIWFRNPGGSDALDPAKWQEYIIDDTQTNGAGVQIGDIDKDGHPDIVYSGYNTTDGSKTTIIYFAPSDPTNITGWVRVPVGRETYRTELVDFDGDGDLDILMASFGVNGAVSWLENPLPNGNPRDPAQWKEYVIEQSPTTKYTNRVWAADVDGDGKLDICMASDPVDSSVPGGSAGYFKWYRRPADPRNIGQYQIYMIDSNQNYTAWAHDACVGDIDQDGDIDMAGVGCNTNTVMWWVNEKKASYVLDSNKWNSSGAPPINNSILTINSGPNQYIQSKQTFQYEAYRCKAQFATYATCGNFGFKSSTIYVGFDDASYCCWSSGAVQSITANNLQWTWGYTGYEGTNWKTWEALWKPNEVKFYVDNQLRQVQNTNIPVIPLPFVVNSDSGSPVINVDWILVRKYSDPEPVASVGLEE